MSTSYLDSPFVSVLCAVIKREKRNGKQKHEPLLFEGEEGVRIVGVELKGLSDIRPTHGARRQGKVSRPGMESSQKQIVDEA